MEVRGNDLLDDLLGNDDDKCLGALTKLLGKVNNGQDIISYFSTIAVRYLFLHKAIFMNSLYFSLTHLIIYNFFIIFKKRTSFQHHQDKKH